MTHKIHPCPSYSATLQSFCNHHKSKQKLHSSTFTATLLHLPLLVALLANMVKKAGQGSQLAESTHTPPATLSDGVLPKMIIFDLDYTLWPFWVDTHVTPPLKVKNSIHDVVHDRFGESFSFYSDVPSILYHLREQNIKVGAASRTSAPDLGREMLKLLHIHDGSEGKKRKAIDYFDHLEIYPGSKTTHFTKLQRATGIDFKDMLFFDDEARNRNVESLGVTMYLVRDGVTRHELDNGIREWRKRHGHNGKPASD